MCLFLFPLLAHPVRPHLWCLLEAFVLRYPTLREEPSTVGHLHLHVMPARQTLPALRPEVWEPISDGESINTHQSWASKPKLCLEMNLHALPYHSSAVHRCYNLLPAHSYHR